MALAIPSRLLAFIAMFAVMMPVPSLEGADALPGCQSQCGDVSIPYPFGIAENCSLNTDFQLLCSNNKPYLVGDEMEIYYEIHNISLQNANIRLSIIMPPICKSNWTYWTLWANRLTFKISPIENVFTVVGCNVLGILNAYTFLNRTVSCISTCPPAEKGEKQLVDTGDCNGVGCCQISIGVGKRDYQISVKKIDGAEIKNVSDVRDCYRAFLVEKGRYDFQGVEERVDPNVNGTYPLVVWWSMGENTTCEEAMKNRTSYACKDENSVCQNARAWGYLCRCKDGYQGNPYLPDGTGCQDIDECQTGAAKCGDLVCINRPGSFTCASYKSRKTPLGIIIGVGGSVGFFLVIAVVALCYTRWQKQTKIREMQRHFHRNFHLLQEQLLICSYDGGNISKLVTFFTLKDLKKATNNFDSSHVVGQGGHGTVYKGLIDLRVVAIKKSNIVVENEITGFINEIILLSHIRHRNIVKLIGCCFETEVPLLVYEFISNGTLAEHLHKHNQNAPLPWKDRLRIAAEIARSISYLHSAANISIFHRDIKSSNILLDDKLTAKVSDFGASKFVEMDKTHVSTNIHGTFGYLDPEYMYTGQLTDKSDVYSLGVILVELVTGKKPSSILLDREDGNMISHFIWAFNENKLFDVVEASIAEDDTREEIEAVARLALDCLSFRGKERPNMKEVEAALEGARKLKNEGKIEGVVLVHTDQQDEAEGFPYDS